MEITTAKGILYLALVPTLVITLTISSVRFSLLQVGNLSVIVVYTLAVYFLLLFRSNSYSDSRVLEKVVVPNAPPEVEELLKKQTRNHELIYVILIKILGKKKKLSQVDIVKKLKNLGIEYSQPAVETYLSDMEDKEMGIVESDKGYRRLYSLTRRGEWCYKAVKVCFPKRFLYFIIRHYLGRRKLPPFLQ